MKKKLIGLVLFGTAPVVQAFTLLLTANTLEVSDFGALIAYQSVIFIFLEISGFGAGEFAIKKIAVDKLDSQKAWGESLYITFISVPIILPFSTFAIILASYAMNRTETSEILLCVILSFFELMFTRLNIGMEQLNLALSRNLRANLYRVFPPAFRLLCVFVSVFWLNVDHLNGFFVAYSISVFLSFLTLLTLQLIVVGHPHIRRPLKYLEGKHFCLTQFISAIQANFDKILVGFLFSSEILANYTVALRVLQFSVMPIQAIQRSIYRDFFVHGANGVEKLLSFLKKTLPEISSALAFSTALIALAYYFINYFIKPEYKHVDELLLSMLALPIFVSLKYISSDILTGLALQSARNGIALAAALAQYIVVWIAFEFDSMYLLVFSLYFNMILVLTATIVVLLCGRRPS